MKLICTAAIAVFALLMAGFWFMEPFSWAFTAGIVIGAGSTFVPALLIASGGRTESRKPAPELETPPTPPRVVPSDAAALPEPTPEPPVVHVLDVPLAWRLPGGRG